jgi:hypothetical protein
LVCPLEAGPTSLVSKIKFAEGKALRRAGERELFRIPSDKEEATALYVGEREIHSRSCASYLRFKRIQTHHDRQVTMVRLQNITDEP